VEVDCRKMRHGEESSRLSQRWRRVVDTRSGALELSEESRGRDGGESGTRRRRVSMGATMIDLSPNN